MESVMSFLADNYIWFFVVAGVLCFALIGFIIDSKKKGDEETVPDKLSVMSEEEPAVAEAVWNTLLYWDETNKDGFAKDTLDTDLSQDDDLCFVVMGFALNSNGSMKEELIDRLIKKGAKIYNINDRK